MGKRIYLICPVRAASAEAIRFADEYVATLEARGDSVHYPPRDVDQTDDGVGLVISEAHRAAMLTCDEVHVVWDSSSFGSHFDFGMAFMLRAFRQVPLVVARPVEPTAAKSYGNKLAALAARDASAARG